eukprot:gene16258-1283_t
MRRGGCGCGGGGGGGADSPIIDGGIGGGGGGGGGGGDGIGGGGGGGKGLQLIATNFCNGINCGASYAKVAASCQAIDLVEERDPTIKFDVTVARSPFFLYPGGGHSIKPWGERIDALYSPTASQSIGALGAAAGYNFDFSVMLSDTMDSHRLVLWADATPLADRSMLFEVVSQTDGLDPEAAKEYLETEQGYDDVLKAVEAARLEGIHSIPVFVFTSGSFSATVHGSADVQRFAGVLDDVEAHWRGGDLEENTDAAERRRSSRSDL